MQATKYCPIMPVSQDPQRVAYCPGLRRMVPVGAPKLNSPFANHSTTQTTNPDRKVCPFTDIKIEIDNPESLLFNGKQT